MSTELTPTIDPGRYETALPLSKVQESKTNPRRTFDPELLQELADSIRSKGLIEPIVVRPMNGGASFELVCGARRLRAAKLAGLEALPASVRVLSDQDVLELQLIENLQRRDLHALEEAAGYQALMRTAKYDVARIAARIGRSPKYVYDRVKLLALTKEAQALFLDGKFTAGHAILLARLKPEDQKRALAVGDAVYHKPALFTDDRSLFGEDSDTKDLYAYVKPASVGEFQQWIDDNVKFDAGEVDPMLFPETAVMLGSAKEQAEKVIAITRDYRASDPVKVAAGGQRIYGDQSWKPADGKGKDAKECERSVIGVVVCGPGRGDAFRVCADKERCAIHWAKEQRQRKERQAATVKGGAPAKSARDAYAVQEQERKEQQARQEAERKRWETARPAILDALAERVRQVPWESTGLLAQTLTGVITERRYGVAVKSDAGLFPQRTSAEDLVRHLVFVLLAQETRRWDAAEFFPKRARAFGLDVRKILDQAAPAPTKERSCRFCGCTEKKACSTIGGPCTWLTADVCSAASCEAKLQGERKKKATKKGPKK